MCGWWSGKRRQEISCSIELEKKIFDGSGVPLRCLKTGEKSRLSTEKSTSFDSEFHADSEYITLFEKFFGQKNGLTATCPLWYNNTQFSSKSIENL